MLEISIERDKSIFDLPQNGDAVCVTTNGVVKKNGHAVMGKGIALEANNKFNLSRILAEHLNYYGNVVGHLGVFKRNLNNEVAEFHIFSFPTKHDWRDDSNIFLIIQSANDLVRKINHLGIERCYLTPPGCGNGNLDWEGFVKPNLSNILDNRFIIVMRE